MQLEAGTIEYPLPWASNQEMSHLEPPASYQAALDAAGFEVTAVTNRHQFALDLFDAMQQARASAQTPPSPLGMHLLMGSTAPAKGKNLMQSIRAGLLASVEIVAQKR